MQLQLIKSPENCRVRWLDLTDWIIDSWPWPLTSPGTPSNRQDRSIVSSGLPSPNQRGPTTSLRMRCADVGFDDAVPSGVDRPMMSSETPDVCSRAAATTSEDPLVRSQVEYRYLFDSSVLGQAHVQWFLTAVRNKGIANVRSQVVNDWLGRRFSVTLFTKMPHLLRNHNCRTVTVCYTVGSLCVSKSVYAVTRDLLHNTAPTVTLSRLYRLCLEILSQSRRRNKRIY